MQTGGGRRVLREWFGEGVVEGIEGFWGVEERL